MERSAQDVQMGKYLTLEAFCTCTRTYQKYADQIAPFPKNPEETIPALRKRAHQQEELQVLVSQLSWEIHA